MSTTIPPNGPPNAASRAGVVANNAAALSSNPLQRLYAVNPKLEAQVKADPGLRAFLEKNVGVIANVDPPPHGSVKTNVSFDTWTHATSIVPPSIRDEEYIVVIARGSAYSSTGQAPANGAKQNVQIPLQGGGMGTSDGVIAYVGKTGDYLHTFVDDNDKSFPGSGTVTFGLPVHGKPGEKVELSYCRIKPDAQGKSHPSRAAWPDSFDGVYGGYAGRDRSVTIAANASVKLKNPD